MKIAIVGTGISGLVCAHLLHEGHELTLFEAADYIGGHTNTLDVETSSGRYAIDTGFIVFNDWTYPNFIKLLEKLGVPSQPSDMSFSVRCERTGLEYNGTSINTLFAQRSNLVSPRFWRMLADIARFGRRAPALLDTPEEDPPLTMGEYLEREGYSDAFRDLYIIPMGAAIWSASPGGMAEFPARFFLRFFKNHGMLNVLAARPQWRVVKGGSREYVKVIVRPFADRIRLNTPVRSVARFDDRVELRLAGDRVETFDHVILALHSDQALSTLSDPTKAESEILGALPYQPNLAILHTDTSVMPKRRLAWAAWNYHLAAEERDSVALTYDMNILQSIAAPETFLVSLNCEDMINPAKVIRRIPYHHPIYSTLGVAEQARYDEIGGTGRTHYCGAYWGYGFHEDGVNSALRVGKSFGRSL